MTAHAATSFAAGDHAALDADQRLQPVTDPSADHWVVTRPIADGQPVRFTVDEVSPLDGEP